MFFQDVIKCEKFHLKKERKIIIILINMLFDLRSNADVNFFLLVETNKFELELPGVPEKI